MFARVTRGQGGPVRLALEVAPDAATVTITRLDGTAVVTDGAATVDAEGAEYALAPAEADTLGMLSATWTVELGTETITVDGFVEVVGARLVSLAELRAIDGLEALGDAELEAGRLLAETALEDAAGVAFTPRRSRVVLDGPGGTDLFIPGIPMLKAVEAGSVDGTALSVDELGELVTYEAEGTVYAPSGWSEGRRNVTLDVEHGFTYLPPRVGQAVKAIARHTLVESPLDDRTISATNEDGTVQVMVQAGVRGAVFALPEANAVLAQYGFREVV